MSNTKPYLTGNSVDPALLENEIGHEFRQRADPANPATADDIIKPIGAVRRSEETDVHITGAGDEETEDGLSPTEEALRHAAEDREDASETESLPVFDRGDTLPRV